MKNCTIKGVRYYPINIIGAGDTVDIIGCTISGGYCAVNLPKQCTVNIKDSYLASENWASYNPTNNFAVISVGDTTAINGMEVRVENSVLIAHQSTGNRQFIVTYHPVVSNSKVIMDGCDLISNDPQFAPEYSIANLSGTNNTVENTNFSFNGFDDAQISSTVSGLEIVYAIH